MKNFTKKPEHELSNDHYWNSGIFMFKAKRYVDEMERSVPNLYNLCCVSMQHSTLRERFLYLKQQDFVGIESVSVDYLIMEREENVATIEANFDWMDVGTWNAVLELSKRFDKEPVSFQHVTRKKEQNLTAESSENLLSGACKQPDKSLMSFISKVREVKAIRKEIKPWGFCSVILVGENFLVKYLFISPLNCTFRQFHCYRDEYHIVLSKVNVNN